MKKLIFLLVAIVMVISSCEEKIIDLVIKFNDSFVFVADNNGSFTETYTASRDEIMDEVDQDVSGVKDVNISFLELIIQTDAGNQAQRIRASGTFSDNSTPTPILIFENFEFNVSDFNGIAKPVSGYQAAGINALADKIQAYINETDATDFTVEVNGVAIDASGNPVNESMNLTFTITLDAEVILEETADLPSFP